MTYLGFVWSAIKPKVKMQGAFFFSLHCLYHPNYVADLSTLRLPFLFINCELRQNICWPAQNMHAWPNQQAVIISPSLHVVLFWGRVVILFCCVCMRRVGPNKHYIMEKGFQCPSIIIAWYHFVSWCGCAPTQAKNETHADISVKVQAHTHAHAVVEL